MAVRSGAGTGVVVSLVVFILTTFFLLILTIVFYSKQTKALEAEDAAQKTLATYIKATERNNDQFQRHEDAAQNRNKSVTSHLNAELSEFAQFIGLAPGADSTALRQEFQTFVGDNPNIRTALLQQTRSQKANQSEVERLTRQLQDWQGENANLQAQMEQLEETHQDRLSQLDQLISEYQRAQDDYRREVDDTKAMMQSRVDQMQINFDRTNNDLEDEIDQLNEQRVTLIGRVDELEAKVRQNQIAPPDPSTLVDGRVLEAAGSADQIFIDRGRDHHIVRGMTFEVYSDEAALQQFDPITGAQPRGKASVQVIKVGETTSTCKIVRNVPGRPVVRNDVIANAVYDPNYKFKFLIHGKFDIDGDGKPTEAEAEYIRRLVMDWGGQVVTGTELPGDLDFLVLGDEPPTPPLLRDNAPIHEVEIWLRKKGAFETYDDLRKKAADAQIPWLNANRFFILTGYTVG